MHRLVVGEPDCPFLGSQQTLNPDLPVAMRGRADRTGRFCISCFRKENRLTCRHVVIKERANSGQRLYSVVP